MTTTKPKRLNALLDELLTHSGVFTTRAQQYCFRAQRRALDKQKEARRQVDKALDDLIKVFGKCIPLIEQIAAAETTPDYEITLYRRAAGIVEAIDPLHVEAIDKVTQQARLDEARWHPYW
jgi:hypothetical protein